MPSLECLLSRSCSSGMPAAAPRSQRRASLVADGAIAQQRLPAQRPVGAPVVVESILGGAPLGLDPGAQRQDPGRKTDLLVGANLGKAVDVVDLDPATQAQLNRGVRLYELLKQDQYVPMEMEDIIVSLFVGVRGYADRIETAKVQEYASAWLKFLQTSHPEVIKELVDAGYVLNDSIDKKLTDLAESFTSSY